MAHGKKGFVLYADQKELFSQLPNDKAGELIKHIFSYVNDENPETEDPLINLAFTPIKQQLKRDLEKWEDIKVKRSEAGKKSAEARRNKSEQSSTNSTSVKCVEQNSTNPTVIVKVNVNDTVNDNVKDIFNKWLDYRKEIKKPIKSESTLKTLIDRFNKEGKKKCEWVVNKSIENNYQGLFWENYKEPVNSKPKSNPII